MDQNHNQASMDIGIQQWRRDVDTFSESTLSELLEITEQISQGLADSAMVGNTPTVISGSDKNILPKEAPTISKSAQCRQDDTSDDSQPEKSNRLLVLKAKLASRVKEN